MENDEEPRPEFETSVKTFRINPVTREKEAFMPYWWMNINFSLSSRDAFHCLIVPTRRHRFFRLMATGSVVLFMICIVLGRVYISLSLRTGGDVLVTQSMSLWSGKGSRWFILEIRKCRLQGRSLELVVQSVVTVSKLRYFVSLQQQSLFQELFWKLLKKAR